MNLTSKTIILDAVLSILFTLLGGGNFYSFLFFFVLLFLPALLIFVSVETISNVHKNPSSKNNTSKKS